MMRRAWLRRRCLRRELRFRQGARRSPDLRWHSPDVRKCDDAGVPPMDSVEPCAFCREVGCVRVERVIHASVAERIHECKTCGKRWVVAKMLKDADKRSAES